MFFPQCDLQAFGLKKWSNKSADTQSNGLLSETFATKVSTVSNLGSISIFFFFLNVCVVQFILEV